MGRVFNYKLYWLMKPFFKGRIKTQHRHKRVLSQFALITAWYIFLILLINHSILFCGASFHSWTATVFRELVEGNPQNENILTGLIIRIQFITLLTSVWFVGALLTSTSWLSLCVGMTVDENLFNTEKFYSYH